jgi:hypothetical protein
MVGAEGFEGSYTRDRYAVLLVGFNRKTTQFEGLARILRRTLLLRIFSPMDSFSQDFRITSYPQRGAKSGWREFAFSPEKRLKSTEG